MTVNIDYLLESEKKKTMQTISEVNKCRIQKPTYTTIYISITK